MSAAAADDPGHGTPWWQTAAKVIAIGLAIMLFLICVFDVGGPSFQRGGGYFGGGLTNISQGLTQSRPGIMIMIQFAIAIGASLWIIRWAMGNSAYEKKIAALEADLAAARKKKAAAATPAPAPAPATP